MNVQLRLRVSATHRKKRCGGGKQQEAIEVEDAKKFLVERKLSVKEQSGILGGAGRGGEGVGLSLEIDQAQSDEVGKMRKKSMLCNQACFVFQVALWELKSSSNDSFLCINMVIGRDFFL